MEPQLKFKKKKEYDMKPIMENIKPLGKLSELIKPNYVIMKDQYKVETLEADGFSLWIQERSEKGITVSIEIDPFDFLKSEIWETEPNNPDTDTRKVDTKEVLENMSDKELIPFVIEHLKCKLLNL